MKYLKIGEHVAFTGEILNDKVFNLPVTIASIKGFMISIEVNNEKGENDFLTVHEDTLTKRLDLDFHLYDYHFELVDNFDSYTIHCDCFGGDMKKWVSKPDGYTKDFVATDGGIHRTSDNAVEAAILLLKQLI